MEFVSDQDRVTRRINERYVHAAQMACMPEDFMVDSFSAEIDSCLKLMTWNNSALQGTITPALYAAFIAHIVHTGGSLADQFNVLCTLAKHHCKEDIEDMKSIINRPKHSNDAVFDEPGLDKKGGRMAFLERMLRRADGQYPHLKLLDLSPDQILSPTVIYQMAEAFNKNYILAQVDVLKIETYQAGRKIDNSKNAKASVEAGSLEIVSESYGERCAYSLLSAQENVKIILNGILISMMFVIPDDSRDGKSGIINGRRYFGTLSGIQRLKDIDGNVAKMCLGGGQRSKSPHYQYANIWRNAFKFIFNKVRTSKTHFDDVCDYVVTADDVWKAHSIMTISSAGGPEDRPADGGGSSSFSPNKGTRDNPNGYACVDHLNGARCRHLSNGRNCPYSHQPGAVPSPNYTPSSDPYYSGGSYYSGNAYYGSPAYYYPPSYDTGGGGAAAAPAAADGNAVVAANVNGPPPAAPMAYPMPMAPFSMGVGPYAMGYGKGLGKGGGKGKGGKGRGGGRHRGPGRAGGYF
jgi:hypothetical protein